jgi:cell division protein FtsN
VKILRRKQALYQVQIGRFLTQKNANEVGAQLQAEGFISRFSVVAYK